MFVELIVLGWMGVEACLTARGAWRRRNGNSSIVAHGMAEARLAAELERMGAASPAQRVGVGPQHGRVVVGRGIAAAERLRRLETDLPVPEQRDNRISVDVGEERQRVLAGLWIVQAIEAVAANPAHSCADFVHEGRR